MPSSKPGRKLTAEEQAEKKANIEAAPKGVWLTTNRPLAPSTRKRPDSPRAADPVPEAGQ